MSELKASSPIKKPAFAGFFYANYVNYCRAENARLEVYCSNTQLAINILIIIRAILARYDINVLLCATYERYAHK